MKTRQTLHYLILALLIAAGNAFGAGNASLTFDPGTGLLNPTPVTVFPMGPNMIATSAIKGMHNDWTDVLAVRTSGTLIVNGSDFTVAGHAIASGSTVIALASGTTNFATPNGSFALSGTIWSITGRESAHVYNPNNSFNEIGAGIVLGGTGTDDWAVVEPYLKSNRPIWIDSSFGVSKSARPGSGSFWQGDGRHKIGLEANSNMPVVEMALTGSTISTRDWTIQNCVFDCNGMFQSLTGGGNESTDPWNMQGDTQNYGWIVGIRLGSSVNGHFDYNRVVDAFSFQLLYHHFYFGSIHGNRFEELAFYASAPFIFGQFQPLHHDGMHGDGPIQGNDLTGNYFKGGDDDQNALLPIESTPESEANFGTVLSLRRGHGGQISGNLIGRDVFDNTIRDYRFGQQAFLSSTYNGGMSPYGYSWASEDYITHNTFVCSTGTVYDRMALENVFVTQNHFTGGWDITSGTTQAGAINLSPGDTNTGNTIDGIRTDVSVFCPPNTWANNDNISIGGSYGDAIARLRNGVVAAWRMQDGTDSSGNVPVALTASNGAVSFTANAIGRKTAVFSGTGCLILTGTAMPRLDLMPEWTISGQIYFTSVTSEYAPLLTTGSNGASVATLAVDTGNSSTMLYYGGSPYFQGTGFSGTGHWYSVVVRKRAIDGAISLSVNVPNGPPSIGPWISGAGFTMPGYTQLEIGADTWDNRYMNGQVSNLAFHKRCVTDDEVNLLIAPSDDGDPYNYSGSSGIPPATTIPGRFWPYNY